MIYTLTLNPALDREMTVSEIMLDEVLRATSVKIDYGGKGFNVSRALIAMGIKSTALGFIGGTVGDQMVSGLTQLGIYTDFIRVDGETRINLSVVDNDHTHYFKINEPGPLIDNSEANAMLEKINKLSNEGDWWVLSGSSPPGIHSGFLTKVIQLVQSVGGFVAVDMEGHSLKESCIAKPALIKPNAIEASQLLGYQIILIADAIKSVPLMHEIGAQRVSISLGKAGAVYSDGKHAWWAKPPSIKEQNPIGAGDAMLAGMLWALQKNLDGDEVLRWGVACGAAAASLGGTAVGSFQLVESLAGDVFISEV